MGPPPNAPLAVPPAVRGNNHWHRPYPMPRGPWVMAQGWRDLLFAHWPVAMDLMRRLVPESLPLDTFDGRAWISIVPFRMEGVRPRLLPALPWLSAFPELNARTYVTRGGRPGVYFFSLDAGNPLAVRIARKFFHLPYFDADMTLFEKGDWFEYDSRRAHRGQPPARFVGRYRPTGGVYRAEDGSLDQWLTERYCMYPVSRTGRVYRGEIHHAPWPLQPAEAEIEINTLTESLGLELRGAPLLHFARRLDVAVWPITRLL